MQMGEHLDRRPEYAGLSQSLRVLLLNDHDLRRRGRVVIGVAGESGSGKSVTATGLARDLDAIGLSTCVLHQDDYFRLPPRTNHEHRVRDLGHVGPQEVNLELLQQHVDAFLARRDDVIAPSVDYPGNKFLVRHLDFSGIDALIVEGTYAFRLANLDIRIFLTATHADTRERRRSRNRDIDAPVIDEILAIESRFIAPQVEHADIVIDRHFSIIRPA